MISSLFRRASAKQAAQKNNNNGAEDVLNLYTHTTEVLPSDDDFESTLRRTAGQPENIDQLTVAVRRLMMDDNLEVSKVRPFFWSLVEIYVDRFHIYPFDIVKALFSYLESQDYPQELMRELITKLEESYTQQYGEPAHKNKQMICEEESLDDEIKELRETLKYASLVGELEEEV